MERATFFISGAFAGAAVRVRELITLMLREAGHAALVKHGGVVESAASMIKRSDALIFIMGAMEPVIQDVWDRTLVDAELDYARFNETPVIAVLIGVKKEDALPDSVKRVREALRRQIGERVIELEDWVDDPEVAGAEPPSEELLAKAQRALAGLGGEGWRAYAGNLHYEHLFLSYSRKDLAIVEGLQKLLGDDGFLPWFDLRSLRSGDDFKREIEKTIRKSDAFLLFLSRDSVASPWVQHEAKIARDFDGARGGDRGFIFPVRVGDLEPGDLPEPLQWVGDLNWTDVGSSNTEIQAGRLRLAEALRRRPSDRR